MAHRLRSHPLSLLLSFTSLVAPASGREGPDHGHPEEESQPDRHRRSLGSVRRTRRFCAWERPEWVGRLWGALTTQRRWSD
jgi:hypothetical protein